MDGRKSFSFRLSKAMRNANIRQIELSEKTGISRAMISQYLSGAYKPKQINTYKLAKALNVPVEYLLGLVDDALEVCEKNNCSNSKLSLIARRIETEFTEEDADNISIALDIIRQQKKGAKNS